MLPDEILRLPNDRSLVLLRGQKPLLLNKIIPDELPSFKKLVPVRITNYVPVWRKAEEEKCKALKKKTEDKPIPQEEFIPAREAKPCVTPKLKTSECTVRPDDAPLLIPKSKLEEINPSAILGRAKR